MNGNEPDEVVINGNVEELKESNKKNEEMEINEIPMSKIQADVTSKQIPVDLDASQDSSQSVYVLNVYLYIVFQDCQWFTKKNRLYEKKLKHSRFTSLIIIF